MKTIKNPPGSHESFLEKLLKISLSSLLSVNSIPFYAFTEGHEMIVDLEKLCKLHFNHVVTSKIFVAAIKTKPNIKIAEKTVMAFVQNKKWKKSKELFHQQFKKEIEQDQESDNMSCVIN